MISSRPSPPHGPGFTPRPQPPSRIQSGAARTFWRSFPVWSLGLLAWVPALRFARRARTRAAWLAFSGFLAGSVVEVVLVETVKADSGASSAAGGYSIALMVGGAFYDRFAARSTGGPGGRFGSAPPPLGDEPPFQRYTPTHQYAPTQQFAQPGPTRSFAAPAPTTAATPNLPPVPPALDPTAAEVQAGLRELREILGHEGDRP